MKVICSSPPGSGSSPAWRAVPAHAALFLGIVAAALLLPRAALADLKLCNATSSRVGIAIGYKDPSGWTTEGWWNVASHSCETLLKGNLIARYYYLHAIDYDKGGEWRGNANLCIDDKAFTIKGVTNCAERGYKSVGFFEVDTGEEQNWTVRLTDPAEAGAKAQ
ncbi:MAG: hypothetical protein Kow0032_19980 [Methyloligellaceae bacterium]